MKHFIRRIVNKLNRIFLNKNKNETPKKQSKSYFNNGANPLDQNTTEIYNQFYSDREGLDDYYNNERLNFYNAVVELILLKNIDLNNLEIADFGCGSGHLLEYISQKFELKKSSGFDFSSAGIEHAKEIFIKHSFFVENIYDNVSENTYDFIVCTEVLEHLEYPEKAVNNMLLSLKSKGVLLLTVPNGRIDTIEEHINFWSPESWKIFISSFINKNFASTFDYGTFNNNKNNYGIIILTTHE